MSYFASSTTTRAKKGRINAVNRLAIREQWLLLEFEGLIADLLVENPWHSVLHEACQEVNKKNPDDMHVISTAQRSSALSSICFWAKA